MSNYDWNLSAGLPLCERSDAFYRTGRDTIFRQLTTDTTPEQWQEALESLIRLRDDLVQDIRRPMHYGALVGTHRCVDQLFTEARARLRGLQILQPQPAPQPPAPPQPRPRQLQRSPDEVVNDAESLVDQLKQPGDTYLGEERTNNTLPGGRT
jgi:hypothetical protein